MFFVLKRPFGPPNAVIYSYELSKLFLDNNITSILEVGCGVGIFATRYAACRRNVLVVGIDQSARTIEYLAANYEKYYKNLQLRECDFCQLSLDLGSTFDAVYSSDVLEHATNTQSFVQNIHRHLRDGGKAVVNFPNQTTHGINHFNEVKDVHKLFGAFRDVRVFVVDITHPVERLWFGTRAFYEELFSRSTKEARKRLYFNREEQGIDRFEDSTCFDFIKNRGKIPNLMAVILAEVFLLVKPRIQVREVEGGSILNCPRLVVVARK